MNQKLHTLNKTQFSPSSFTHRNILRIKTHHAAHRKRVGREDFEK